MSKRKAEKKPADGKSTAVPPMKIEQYMANLKVILTKDEIADRADRAAGLLQDRDTKEEEQKARAKAEKAVIESIESELRRVSNEVRTKATYQDVQCERRYVYEKGKVQEWRLDTGEMTSERDMNEAEKQRDLPFDDDDKGAGGVDLDDEFGGGDDDGKKAAE
jgi:ribosomal protein S18